MRALAALLPPIRAIVGCPYRCAPGAAAGVCQICAGWAAAARLPTGPVAVPVVDLQFEAIEDRVAGTLDLQQALGQGVKAFEPALQARQSRISLYR